MKNVHGFTWNTLPPPIMNLSARGYEGGPQSSGDYRKHCAFVDVLMIDSGWSTEEIAGLGERWAPVSRAGWSLCSP